MGRGEGEKKKGRKIFKNKGKEPTGFESKISCLVNQFFSLWAMVFVKFYFGKEKIDSLYSF